MNGSRLRPRTWCKSGGQSQAGLTRWPPVGSFWENTTKKEEPPPMSDRRIALKEVIDECQGGAWTQTPGGRGCKCWPRP